LALYLKGRFPHQFDFQPLGSDALLELVDVATPLIECFSAGLACPLCLTASILLIKSGYRLLPLDRLL
jgi:hypothetical protein